MPHKEMVMRRTLSGTLDYQACNDSLCFDPVSVPLTFTLELKPLDRQRAGRGR